MPVRPSIAWLCFVLFAGVWTCPSGLIVTQYGFFIEGEPAQRLGLGDRPARNPGPINYVNIWAVNDGMRTYYLSRHLIDADQVVLGESGVGLETFTLRHRRTGGLQQPALVGGVDQFTPFGAEATRTISLRSRRGRQSVVQGVTKLRPDWIGVESLNMRWSYALSTDSQSDADLLALLDAATDRESANDRMARVRFLIQAGRLAAADAELNAAVQMFPSLDERAARFRELADRSYGTQAIGELERRQRAGQHGLVRRLLDAFDPDRVDATTFGRADAMRERYAELLDRNGTIRIAIETLEGELSPEQRRLVAPLRPLLFEQLTIDTIDRLGPFEDVIDDVGLPADEKLAMAYSSFVAGEEAITQSLGEAARLWDLRSELMQTLRARDDYDLREGIDRLRDSEGASVPRVKALLRRLPPVETSDPVQSDGSEQPVSSTPWPPSPR